MDFTGTEVLAGLIAEVQEHSVRLVFADLPETIRAELIKDGASHLVGDDRFFGSIQDVVDAYQQREIQPATTVASQKR